MFFENCDFFKKYKYLPKIPLHFRRPIWPQTELFRAPFLCPALCTPFHTHNPSISPAKNSKMLKPNIFYNGFFQIWYRVKNIYSKYILFKHKNFENSHQKNSIKIKIHARSTLKYNYFLSKINL